MSMAALAPEGTMRMGANPHANGGLAAQRAGDARFHPAYAVDVPTPGVLVAEGARIMGTFLRDVLTMNAEAKNFRIVSPDETASNRWNAVFDVTMRESTAEITRRSTIMSRPTAAWRDGSAERKRARTYARAGWKAICSRGGTDFSAATRRLSTSWIRCSISMPSG